MTKPSINTPISKKIFLTSIPENVRKTALSIFGICSIGLVTNIAQADSRLLVDDNIKVTAIDGEAVNESMFQRDQMSFDLPPGQHTITGKYDRLFELKRGDHDYLRSQEISITASMMDNQTYKLVMPNQPNNYRDAQKYVENPSFAILSGSKIMSESTQNHQNQPQQKTSNHKKPTAIFSSLGQAIGFKPPAQSPASTSTNISSASVTASTVSSPVADSSTLDQFMQLWLKATPEERVKIRQWIAE